MIHGRRQRLFFWLVIVYWLGAVIPGPALRLRDVVILSAPTLGGDLKLPTVLLGVLVFLAGLSVSLRDLKDARRNSGSS